VIPIMERVIGPNEEWSLVNVLKGQKNAPKLGKYYMESKTGNEITMYNGIRVVGDFNWKDDPFKFSKSNGGNVPDDAVKKGPDKLFQEVIEPYLRVLNCNWSIGLYNMKGIDKVSMRQLLLEKYKDEIIVDFIETTSANVTGYFEKAASEIVIDNLDLDSKNAQYQLINGGASKLTDGMVEYLQDKEALRYNHEVQKLVPCENLESIEVSGKLTDDEPFSRSYTHVISTVTNHAFRLFDTDACNLSLAKRTAIRSLRYDHSTKVALKFKTRFWQKGEHPIIGGLSTTDMPIRQVVYPSYGCATDTGVMIVSYTWAMDADFMGNLSVNDEERAVHLCISNLAKLHDVDEKQLHEDLVSYEFMDWSAEKYAQGAYAMFAPGQFSTEFMGLLAPEVDGRLLFAGEAASVHHAWIVGSLNSAYRCVDQILIREERHDLRKKLRKLWGVCSESDQEILILKTGKIPDVNVDKRYSK